MIVYMQIESDHKTEGAKQLICLLVKYLRENGLLLSPSFPSFAYDQSESKDQFLIRRRSKRWRGHFEKKTRDQTKTRDTVLTDFTQFRLKLSAFRLIIL